MTIIFQSVSWYLFLTLIHMGWIGLVIGWLASSGSGHSENRSPKHAYRWNLFCLAIFAACVPLAIFLASMLEPPASFSVASIDKTLTSKEPTSIRLPEPDSSQSKHGRRNGVESPPRTSDNRTIDNRNAITKTPIARTWLVSWIQTVSVLAPWIAAAYFSVFVVLLARLLIGGWGCRRLKSRAEPIVDADFLDLVANASSMIGLRYLPAVASCKNISVPIVLGVIQPVILLPTSMLTSLSVEQLRAILAHEFAHLKRYDHVAIVFQRVIEAVLFFHPTTWVISRRLDHQRELCCDDLVVDSGIENVKYADSLFQVAKQYLESTREPGISEISVAASGDNPSLLLARIRRILDREPNPPTQSTGATDHLFAGLVPVLLIVVFALTMGAFVNTTDAKVATPGESLSLVMVPQVEEPKVDATPIRFAVVDMGNQPLPDCEIEVYQTTFSFGNYADMPQRKLANLITGMDGEVQLELEPLQSHYLMVIAKTPNEQFSGHANIHRGQLKKRDRFEIQLLPTISFNGQVLDHDTGEPISDCQIEFSAYHKGAISWLKLDRSTVSNQAGNFRVKNWLSKMTCGMRVSHPDYCDFDRFSLRVDPQKDDELPAVVYLLSKSSLQRAHQAARLSLPDTTNMTPQKTFKALTNRYEIDRKAWRRNNSQDPSGSLNFISAHLLELRTLPTEIYHEEFWKLANDNRKEHANVQIDSLLWLLDSYPIDYPEESARVTQALAQRFSAHPKLSDLNVLLSIRSWHPEPLKALQQIVDTNPNRAAQGRALMQMVHDLVNVHPLTPTPSRLDGLKETQQKRRELASRVKNEYGDVLYGAGPGTLGQSAQRYLDWLDQYGIGSSPPEINAETLEGEKFSLRQYRDKIVVIHFFRATTDDEFRQLKSLASQYPGRLQLVGVAYGDREKTIELVKQLKIDWPVVWDPYQGMTYKMGAISEDQNGWRWGNEKLGRFEKFENFLIDTNGKIQAAGLNDFQLKSEVAQMLK